MLSTIGYEKVQLDDFVGTLLANNIQVLVDIRERAQSRRRGFSKTALSNRLAESGIGYVHFRSLGDPKEGRLAARSGDYDRFRIIYHEVMQSAAAMAAIAEIATIAETQSVCLLCYERDHELCHRKIVADELETTLGVRARHLGVQVIEPSKESARRMLHSRQSAAA
ncbi:MAG: DUF488 domain-containing protein [Pseudomonadota bacterium]